MLIVRVLVEVAANVVHVTVKGISYYLQELQICAPTAIETIMENVNVAMELANACIVMELE